MESYAALQARPTHGDCPMPKNKPVPLRNATTGHAKKTQATRPREPRLEASTDAEVNLQTVADDGTGRRRHLKSVGSNGSRRGCRFLRHVPTTMDLVVNIASWLIASVVFSSSANVSQTAVMTIGPTLSLIVLFRQAGLYLARITSVRLQEMAGVLRSVAINAAGWALIGLTTSLPLSTASALFALASGLTATFVCRSAFRAWLFSQRSNGRFTRPVLIVGTNAEAAAVVDLLGQHPELGFSPTGVFGSRTEAFSNGLGDLWIDRLDTTDWKQQSDHSTGAIIATTALETEEMNLISRTLLANGLYVHLTSGLAGFASHRLTVQSIGYEPFVYVEPMQLARWQTWTKRALDIAIASVLLIPAIPVIALFALIVKLEDRGPALFRQARVGRHGEDFTMLKLRTMVVDAEGRLAALQSECNERSGPLFKMDRDPRFTRVGRILDVTSINELPQLWNVLRGDMSIVGPRPSLRREHERFDETLRARTVVRPGITGLWQIEARDNPSFDAYRRLDLHYVENWSVSLDVVILAATAEAVAGRVVRTLVKNRHTGGMCGDY
jgi:exopolysaccharide biosynthesis polyprenyl glycosylphosphotransferase